MVVLLLYVWGTAELYLELQADSVLNCWNVCASDRGFSFHSVWQHLTISTTEQYNTTNFTARDCFQAVLEAFKFFMNRSTLKFFHFFWPVMCYNMNICFCFMFISVVSSFWVCQFFFKPCAVYVMYMEELDRIITFHRQSLDICIWKKPKSSATALYSIPESCSPICHL